MAAATAGAAASVHIPRNRYTSAPHRAAAAPKAGEGGALLAALQAEPLGSEELYGLACRLHPGPGAHAWLMERLVEAEARGLAARYPDGRWGPAA